MAKRVKRRIERPTAVTANIRREAVAEAAEAWSLLESGRWDQGRLHLVLALEALARADGKPPCNLDMEIET